jgi:putative flippase GtrA
MDSYITRIIKPMLKARFPETRVTLPRYIAVSILGVGIGTLVLWFFTDIVELSYLIAGAIGAFLSVVNDFFLHQIWTFSYLGRQKRFKGMIKRFGKFAASKSLGFLVALSVLAFFTQVVGFHYLVSNLFAVGASFACNYILSSQWVWYKRKTNDKDKLTPKN